MYICFFEDPPFFLHKPLVIMRLIGSLLSTCPIYPSALNFGTITFIITSSSFLKAKLIPEILYSCAIFAMSTNSLSYINFPTPPRRYSSTTPQYSIIANTPCMSTEYYCCEHVKECQVRTQQGIKSSQQFLG